MGYLGYKIPFDMFYNMIGVNAIMIQTYQLINYEMSLFFLKEFTGLGNTYDA
jgi:hypothetical protein